MIVYLVVPYLTTEENVCTVYCRLYPKKKAASAIMVVMVIIIVNFFFERPGEVATTVLQCSHYQRTR